MKIALNIGHGGDGLFYDPGAIAADGTREHRFNSDELGPRVAAALADLGHTVTTISQLRQFSELAARINALDPHCVLSLHFNAFNRRASGTETLYWHTSARGRMLATILQKTIVGGLSLPDRGAKALRIGDRGAPLLQQTRAPAVILEPFFGDNPFDLARVRQCLPELGLGIADAVHQWYNNP